MYDTISPNVSLLV